jgi:hypothetical protein
MSRPKTNCPGVACKVVRCVLRIVYAAADKIPSNGSSSTISSSSKVCSILPTTWCTLLQIALACGFLTEVGLQSIWYSCLISDWKSGPMNSLPLS